LQAVAVVSTIVGTVVLRVQKEHPEMTADSIARALALVCGAFLLFVGLIRAGFIVEFISLVAIASFMTGAALNIASGQIPGLLGITGINTREATYSIIINTLKNLHRAKLDAALGLSALFTLYFIRWICGFLGERQPQRKKLWFFLGTLRQAFIVIVYILVSWLVNRDVSKAADARFRVLGTIPSGEHSPTAHKGQLEQR
jgi:sodium-independent sulfate anion transporter 11